MSNGVSDDPYMDAIRGVQYVRPEDVPAMFARARSGDTEARDQLVVSVLPAVVNGTRRFAHVSVPRADLIQAGNLGVMQAVDKFDPDHGVLWITYAMAAAIREMSKVIIRARVVRVPDWAMRRLVELGRKAQLEGRDMEDLVENESTPLRVECLRRAMPSTKAISSIDYESVMTQVSVDEDVVAEDEARKHDAMRVYRALDALRPIHRDTLRQRFGLDGGEPMTLRECGVVAGVTWEAVRQREIRALDLLAAKLARTGT